MIRRLNSRVESFSGQNLHERVLCVGFSSITISVAMFIGAGVSVMTLSPKDNLEYKKNPLLAVNLIFALVALSLSLYQIGISFLLVYQGFKEANIFLSSMWYLSHLSILVIYLVLFSIKTVVCLVHKQLVFALLTFMGGIVYEALFLFFVKFVNEYIQNLDSDRYY